MKIVKELLKRLVVPILTLVMLSLFNFIIITTMFVKHVTVYAIVGQAILMFVIPIALFFLFVNQQFRNVVVLTYTHFSVKIHQLLKEYFESEEFKTTKKIQVEKLTQKANSFFQMQNVFVKKIIDILSLIPYQSIYDRAVTLKNENNIQLDNIFFKCVDEYVADFFSNRVTNIIIIALFLANIIVSIILI